MKGWTSVCFGHAIRFKQIAGRRLAFRLISMTLCVLILCSHTNSFIKSAVSYTGATVIRATIPAPSLKEGILGDQGDQPCVVFLPPSYSNLERRYPVIYFLPGGFGLVSQYEWSLFNLATASEAIIVLVSGHHSIIGGTFFENSPLTGNWRNYLVYDVVSYIDMNFRTIPSRDYRGIAGHSFGGFAALNIAMKHSDVFGSVFVTGPALWDNDGFLSSYMSNMYVATTILTFQENLKSLDPSEAHDAYLSFLHNLPMISSDPVACTIAYGSTYAMSIETGPPYFQYPYFRNASGGIELEPTILNRWQNGLDGVDEKVIEYKENMSSLRGIRVECGLYEALMIVHGCDYFAQKATEQGISVELLKTNYGHDDSLSLRLREYMMPFFSRIFASLARITISPSTLNLRAWTGSVICCIDCIEDFDVREVVAASILLNYTETIDLSFPPIITDLDNDSLPELIVNFNRSAISEYLVIMNATTGNVTLMITGQVVGGPSFCGSCVVCVRIPGDADLNGSVDIADIWIAASAFGSCPGDSRWNTLADENEDGYVGVDDMFFIAQCFGTEA